MSLPDEPTTEQEFHKEWKTIDKKGRWRRVTRHAVFEIKDVGGHAHQYALFIALAGAELLTHPADTRPSDSLQDAKYKAWCHYQQT